MRALIACLLALALSLPVWAGVLFTAADTDHMAHVGASGFGWTEPFSVTLQFTTTDTTQNYTMVDLRTQGVNTERFEVRATTSFFPQVVGASGSAGATVSGIANDTHHFGTGVCDTANNLDAGGILEDQGTFDNTVGSGALTATGLDYVGLGALNQTTGAQFYHDGMVAMVAVWGHDLWDGTVGSHSAEEFRESLFKGGWPIYVSNELPLAFYPGPYSGGTVLADVVGGRTLTTVTGSPAAGGHKPLGPWPQPN